MSQSPGLHHVLPAVAAALGAGEPGPDVAEHLTFPAADRALVWLVDGLGYDLLYDRGGHAPFLTRAVPRAQILRSGFPSTTATSLSSFGTGTMPGAHGMLGYLVRDPDSGDMINHVSWRNTSVDPTVWQPQRCVFETVASAGVPVFQVGPAKFAGSGLTLAAFRGATFVAADSLESRIDTALRLFDQHDRVLVYVYWGDVDKVGHQFGVGSHSWCDALELVDAGAAQLSRALPADVLAMIVADHGMVDVPAHRCLDLAYEPELAAGVAAMCGEPRAPMLHVAPDAGAADVAATWRAYFGERAYVWERDEALDAGLYGHVPAEHAARLGDVIVAMRSDFAVADSRSKDTQWDAMVGMHGALSDAETTIPLLRLDSL